MATREILTYKAKLAEQTVRYEDMIDLLKALARLDLELTAEERSLISTGYKNVVGSRRAAWRIFRSVEQKEESNGSLTHVIKIKDYKRRVESELEKICNDFIDVIDGHLIPSARTVESSVFYYKMRGDYTRYLAEFKNGDEKKEAAERSLKAYQMASSAANSDLSPAHPIRLGLALNFSVFYYEIMNSPERACQLAKQAFEEALVEMDRVSEEYYKDSTLIMQLLRDNLTLWTPNPPEDN